MSTGRQMIPEGDLENVVGGYMHFDQPTKKMTYYKKDGSVVTYNVKQFKNAWSASNTMHAQGMSEDDIVASLLSSGYIE